jgi:hypothetical protein
LTPPLFLPSFFLSHIILHGSETLYISDQTTICKIQHFRVSQSHA